MRDMTHFYKHNEIRSLDLVYGQLYREKLRSGNPHNQEHEDWYKQHHNALLSIANAYDKFAELAVEFSNTHWNAASRSNLQRYYNDTQDRGHRCDHKWFKVLLWGAAGRVMITIQDRYPWGSRQSQFGGSIVTLKGEEEPRGLNDTLYVSGCAGSEREIIKLLNAAIRAPITMRPNSKVTWGF